MFALLAKEIDIMVFYTWGEAAVGLKYDPGFGKEIAWDIPLLEGYNFTFVANSASNPGSHHFNGIINPTLNQEIVAWKPNVIWVWGWAFNSHLKLMRFFHGSVTIWFRGDSTLLDEPKGFAIKKIVRRFLLKWVYRHVDKVFYVGSNNKAYFEKHGILESQLVHAPHVIDYERFADKDGRESDIANEWRKELKIKDSDFVLLFAGKFELKKNPKFLVDLSKEIDLRNLKFLIVGNGLLEAEIKEATKKDERFIFLDFQNQSRMPSLYRLADLFILPSMGPGETWGLAINESLVSGTFVLASCFCGGAIDLIQKENGLIFHPTNDLKNVIAYIYEKISCRENLLEKSRPLLDAYTYHDTVKLIMNELKKTNS